MSAPTPWLSPEQLHAWKALSLMQMQLHAVLSRHLAPFDLSYQDYLILATLADQPDARRRVVELSDELGWEKSRLSHHLTRMCQRGLLSKSPCPDDQRGTFVALSPQGRTVLDHAAPHHVRDVRHYFFDRLTPQQVTTLSRVADEVLSTLTTSHGEPRPRPTSAPAPLDLDAVE